MALPIPNIHYEVLRQDPRNNPLGSFTEDQETAILTDPYNEQGNNPFPMYCVSGNSTLYNSLRATISYKRAGQQVVVIGPRMQQAFENTSLKNVSSQHAKLPFNCFYLATPGSKLKVWGGPDTLWHSVAGAYLIEDPMSPSYIGILIWGEPNKQSVTPLDDAQYFLVVALKEGSVDIEQQIDAIMDTGSDLTKSLDNIEAESKDIREMLGLNQIVTPGINPEQDEAHAYMATVKADLRSFIRVAINTVLFMNSTSCEKVVSDNEKTRRELTESLSRKKHKNGPEANKIKRKLKALPACRTTWIGPTIEQAADRDTDMSSTRSVCSHIRRGHWHTYLSGPKKASDGSPIDSALRQSSLKWIPPIWVEGSAESDQDHRYQIKEPRTVG